MTSGKWILVVKKPGGHWSGHLFEETTCIEDFEIPKKLRIRNGTLKKFLAEKMAEYELEEEDWSPHIFKLKPKK